MLEPPGFLKNQISERELRKMVVLGAFCGIVFYLPFAFIYPRLLGPETVDPVWERAVLAIFASIGFLLPRYQATRPWMQAFLYLLCFVFTGHLFFLVCRNDMNIAYQLGYICAIAAMAFYLDSNLIFSFYVAFNYLLLGFSLFYKISFDTLFFAMVITTILGMDWIALLSRVRVMKSLEKSRAEVMRGAAAIQEKNRKIQSIMENIQQGVLTVESANGQIGAECSAYLYRLMMCQSPNELRHLRDILARTQLSKDQIDQVLSAVACIIQENEIAFAANYHLFPRSLIEGEGPASRYLELDWNPIYDSSTGLVVNLLVCIRDVTELQKLRIDAARGQQELTLLAELVNIPRDRCVSVLDASIDLVKTVPLTAEATAATTLRMVHTLKGNARSFGLLTLAEAAHHCENLVQQGHEINAELFVPLQQLLLLYRHIAEHKLGHHGSRDDVVSIPRWQLKATVSALDQLPDSQRQAFQQLYEVIHASLYLTFQQILAPYLETLPKLAADLGKALPVVHIVDPGVHLQHESQDLIRNIFLHLLRNSLDHGLENPAERLQAQKTAEGHIWLVIKPRPQGLEILFQDDGRGLDLAAIRHKAVEKGLIQAHDSLSVEQIAELIFHAGLSTKDKVTKISGRGVGLDAVRHMLEKSGGSIRLMLDQAKDSERVSCMFVLHLPNKFLAQ